jgi:hypothetical protein
MQSRGYFVGSFGGIDNRPFYNCESIYVVINQNISWRMFRYLIYNEFRWYNRHLSNIDCLSFVMCPLLALVLIVNKLLFFFFCCRQLTVLMKQTRQVVCAIKQSVFHRCLWMISYSIFTHLATLLHLAMQRWLKSANSCCSNPCPTLS